MIIRNHDDYIKSVKIQLQTEKDAFIKSLLEAILETEVTDGCTKENQ